MQRMMLLPQTNRADGRGFKSPRGKVFFCMNLKWVRERLKWKEIQTRCLLMSDWKSRFSWVHSVEFHLIPSFRKIERGREKAQWSESLLKKEKAQWTETLLMRRKKVAGAKLKQIGCVGSQRILIFVSNDEKKKSLNQKFFSAKWLFDERSFYLIVFLCCPHKKKKIKSAKNCAWFRTRNLSEINFRWSQTNHWTILQKFVTSQTENSRTIFLA